MHLLVLETSAADDIKGLSLNIESFHLQFVLYNARFLRRLEMSLYFAAQFVYLVDTKVGYRILNVRYDAHSLTYWAVSRSF